MGKVYKRTVRYKCMRAIHYQGKAFGKSGKVLIESGDGDLFVPGMINICLSVEIFLKSINASTTNLEDEVEVNGTTCYIGRDETLEILPSGKGHALSKLFDGLPVDIRNEITQHAKLEGYGECVSKGLKIYDNVFVDWRYIYERNDPKSLGTHPLFQLVNAISRYCNENLEKVICCSSDEI
ncbi:hypothetical protein HORIV_35030 [Vreelandella olivaria]|uniref:Uncharacterized protein n=1 Tax=Vreelandella olivaria TaxID=390919 RepID=A0ABM7GKD5_9GAMM|nr:hypothetical protein HORIV_35030 [Halomonas olivaria]